MANTAHRGRGRVVSVLGYAAISAFVLGPLGACIEIVRPLTGFYVFGLGSLLGVVALVASVLTALRSGFSAAFKGLALGGLTTAALVLLVLPSRSLPRINDITTDTQNPPRFVRAGQEPENAGRDLSYPGEAFASQQRAAYPRLGPAIFREPPAVVYERVVVAARRMPRWTITRADPGALALEGYDTSRVFRFKDDFVIEVRPAETGAAVHMRSKSRDGRGDLGVNAARIEAFFNELGG